MSELSRFDFEPKRIECEDDGIIIRDDFGRKVVQVAALEDLEALEQEILLIGSYPDRRPAPETVSGGRVMHAAAPKADRAGVLHDNYAAEVLFNVKRRLVEVHLEMYEHTADVLKQENLAQRITGAIATPRQIGSGRELLLRGLEGLRSLLWHQIRETGPPAQMGAIRQPNSPLRSRLTWIPNQIRVIEPGTPCKGSRCPDRTAQMSLALSAEEVSFNEFCPSVRLA